MRLWKLLLVVIVSMASIPLSAQKPDGVWSVVPPDSLVTSPRPLPDKFVAVQLDRAALMSILATAPMEFTPESLRNDVRLFLPLADGTFGRFRIEESPMMEPGLAAKLPGLKTYRGVGIDDPTASTRFDISPNGFHAIILSSRGSTYIDPAAPNELRDHIVYSKNDYGKPRPWQCYTEAGNVGVASSTIAPNFSDPSGLQLLTYRAAVAATGEYTAFHGGTAALAMTNGIIPTMNRVNAIYERELSIHMTLVANNINIVYTNALTDPYTNDDGFAMLAQNQANVDTVIGSGNYDIGHVFSTGGGGIAGLGVVCKNNNKARGVTGSSSPIGDGFDVDYVAHEMGHQFGGNHTFNGTTGACAGGNRNASTAYEVGSGSTIMAYAGICAPQDLQPHSDDYFHWVSIEEITSYVNGGPVQGCPTQTVTGNTIPTVSGGADVTIPRGTPFTLTATGSDADGDPVTYCWEEFDLGAANDGTTDNGASPILRSFNPTTSPSRTFPKLTSLASPTPVYGEILPTVARTMQFKVTIRDNHGGNGGVNDDQVAVIVSTAGPFKVTQPNTLIAWPSSSTQTVTWDVAGTNAAPINTTLVNIYLSLDSGLTYPHVLATSTPNDGTEVVTLPNVSSDFARVKVEAVGHIYFDLSDVDFRIGAPTVVVLGESSTLTAENCAPANGAIDPGETVTLDVTLRNTGIGTATDLVATLQPTGGVTAPSGPQSFGALAFNETATRAFTFTASATCGGNVIMTFDVTDNGTPVGTVSFTWVTGQIVVTNSYSSAIPIVIPDAGIATPYPSTISVSGLNGAVNKVTATLSNFTHTWPNDVDVLLASPSGAKSLVISDVGGGTAVTNVTLTLDPDAATSLSGNTLVSGTYKPTNINTGDFFDAPAPAGPHVADFGLFEGTDPNGTWSLYVRDDASPDAGTISGGWSMVISSYDISCCGAGNTAPTASNDTYPATEDTPLNVTAPGVLANDTDADGDTLTAALVDAATNGSVTLNSDGSFTYTPNANFNGSDSFTYRANDGSADSNLATVTLNVAAVNDAPVATDDSYVTTSDSTLQVAAPGILTNDTDVDGDSLTASLVTGPSNGTLTLAPDGSFDYTPQSGFTGTDGFTYQANDASLPSNIATVTINVTPTLPTVVSISPTAAIAAGGATITITGTNFVDGATVTFGGASATNVTFVNATTLTVTAPALTPGTLNDVVVTNPDAASGTLTDGYMADFLDVPTAHPFHNFVESIFRFGITAGCGGGNYCPASGVTRAQMAVFLLVAKEGRTYAPPPATGTVFDDVAANSFAAAWIEELFNRGITGGCSTSPMLYCPSSTVTRAQMAPFLLVTSLGAGYVPPAPTGVFDDVPTSSPFAKWIEDLFARGITGGCSTNPPLYCPTNPNTRGQMAVFLKVTFALP